MRACVTAASTQLTQCTRSYARLYTPLPSATPGSLLMPPPLVAPHIAGLQPSLPTGRNTALHCTAGARGAHLLGGILSSLCSSRPMALRRRVTPMLGQLSPPPYPATDTPAVRIGYPRQSPHPPPSTCSHCELREGRFAPPIATLCRMGTHSGSATWPTDDLSPDAGVLRSALLCSVLFDSRSRCV